MVVVGGGLAGSTLATVLAVMVGMGLDGASFRLYYDAPDDDRRRSVLSTAVVMQLVVGTAVAALLAASAVLWADPLTGHAGQAGDVRLALASIPATVLLVVAQRYIATGVTAGAVKD